MRLITTPTNNARDLYDRCEEQAKLYRDARDQTKNEELASILDSIRLAYVKQQEGLGRYLNGVEDLETGFARLAEYNQLKEAA